MLAQEMLLVLNNRTSVRKQQSEFTIRHVISAFLFILYPLTLVKHVMNHAMEIKQNNISFCILYRV